jgi:hypothetical protein
VREFSHKTRPKYHNQGWSGKAKVASYAEQRFFEEHTAYQMEEIWKLRHTEPGLFGMVGLEEKEPPSPGIQ